LDLIQILFQIPVQLTNIASILHPQPNLGTIAEHLPKPHCNGRRDSLLLRQNVVEGLSRDSEQPGNRAISTFVFPVAGITISRKSSPGWRASDPGAEEFYRP
jgi:hypothetical protein